MITQRCRTKLRGACRAAGTPARRRPVTPAWHGPGAAGPALSTTRLPQLPLCMKVFPGCHLIVHWLPAVARDIATGRRARRGRPAGDPVTAVFPLAKVQDAYRRLEEGRLRGKIVLVP